MKPIIHLDFETFSEVNIIKAGAYRYAEDESTIPLCMCYLEEDDTEDQPYLWLPGDPFPFSDGYRYAAHNAEFEIYIWMHVMCKKYGWPECPPPEDWVDTAAIARYNGYPGKLAYAADALGLDEQKDMEGHRIMMKLSRPRKPSAANPDERWTPETKPDDFEKLYDYCEKDVLVEREIYRILEALPAEEQKLWVQNVKINLRGIPCDSYLAETVVGMKELHLESLNAELSEITDGEITKTSQTARITEYLGFPELGREFLEQQAEPYIRTEEQRKIVDLRLAASRTSTAKFDALLAAVCEDGRLHGLLMYHAAAQTARYGGSLIQPHNLPRPKTKHAELMKIVKLIHSDRSIHTKYKMLYKRYGSNLMTVFSDLIRSGLWAEEGRTFAVCDFSNVEARILAWEAHEQGLLADFRAGIDPYLGMAAQIYNREITKADSFERSLGKACVLGAGFGMSAPKFHMVCHSWGIPIDVKLAEKAIKAYRTRYQSIVNLWYDLNSVILDVVGGGNVIEFGKCIWRMVEWPRRAMECTLPSGKVIRYPEPKVFTIEAPWNKDKLIDQVHYKTWGGAGVHKKKSGVYVRGKGNGYKLGWDYTDIYGAKAVENITQANARELLADANTRMIKRGLPVMLHIHDESLSQVLKKYGQRALDLKIEIMSNPPDWAKDIPLAAEGYIDERFKKD